MRRLILFLLVFQIAFAPALSADPAPAAQTARAAQLLAQLTPAERVGQLFMVSFYGAAADPGSDIERLISQYHIGGVALLAANDNLTDTVNAPGQVLTITNRLQTIAATPFVSGTVTPAPARPFVPLFIAVNHEGDGAPFTEIRSGLTDLPSAMALGATWDPAQAQAMGAIAGRELSALGVNLLLGPSLDVLETPHPLASGGSGTRVFGGDPFWVGQLGRGYVAGVHAGSVDTVAVAAKFFPGYGASDRDPALEVPTVRKSLEELIAIDLQPFFMVTGATAADAGAAADALVSAHIRFQGFQGNIRQTTSPVSFDPRAFAQLLSLPQIAPWRAAGGLTVSDSLGSRAVKRFYDPTEKDFNPRRIASEAFIAGNDLLFLSDFGLNPRQDQTRNIIDVITYFTDRYATDRAFAGSVDAAVTRILMLKLRLYGGRFSAAGAQRAAAGLAELGQERAQVLDVARNAATLISPAADELAARAPEPPGPNERVVFLVDSQVSRQCTDCPVTHALDRKALENAVLQFYGPAGSGQVKPGNLQSFTFDDLTAYLNARANPTPTAGEGTPTPEASPLEAALDQADWIVLAMLEAPPETPGGNVVSTFLGQRSDLLRSKKTIVFAFGAPYYLDTTDLSKVTAYYALYSKAPAFVEVAARLLFREVIPAGRPPISVESVNYDLLKVTAPDPHQTIQLFSDVPAAESQTMTPAPTGTLTPTQGLKVGDVLNLYTSVILDLNGHPVPDGTPVRFMQVSTTGDGGRDFAFINTETRAGVAQASVTLNRIGFLEISVSEPVVDRSTKLQIPVQQGTTFFITPVVPPTDTATPTPPPTPTATVTVTPSPSPTPAAAGELRPSGVRVNGRDFLLMVVGLGLALVGGYRLGGADAQPRRAVRLALLGALGVLVGYNYYALGMPGALAFSDRLGALASVVFVAAGGLLGLWGGWQWGRRL